MYDNELKTKGKKLFNPNSTTTSNYFSIIFQ